MAKSLTWLSDWTELKKCSIGTSLRVQWLRQHAPSVRGLGSSPGLGARSHILQLRVPTLQWRWNWDPAWPSKSINKKKCSIYHLSLEKIFPQKLCLLLMKWYSFICTLNRASQRRIISKSILDIIPPSTLPIIILIDTVGQIKHKDVPSSFSIFKVFPFFCQTIPRETWEVIWSLKKKKNPSSRDSRKNGRRRDFEAVGKKGKLCWLKCSYRFYIGSSKSLGKNSSYLEEKRCFHPHQALRIVQSQSFSQFERVITYPTSLRREVAQSCLTLRPHGL